MSNLTCSICNSCIETQQDGLCPVESRGNTCDCYTCDGFNYDCSKRSTSTNLILVKEFKSGYILTKKQNTAGGWTYYYDFVIPAEVWDNCIGTKEVLIEIAKDCYGLELVEPKEETIEDGYGNSWPKKCPKCGENRMVVLRPGKIACMDCD